MDRPFIICGITLIVVGFIISSFGIKLMIDNVEKRISVIETVLIMKEIMPSELASEGK